MYRDNKAKKYYGWLVYEDVDFQHESKKFNPIDVMETYLLFDSEPEIEEFNGEWIRDGSIQSMEYCHQVRYVCDNKWVGKNKPKKFKFENNYAYENIELPCLYKHSYFGVVAVDGDKITFDLLPLENDYLKLNTNPKKADEREK